MKPALVLLLVAVFAVAGCGGGGRGADTLTIAPSSVTLSPGESQTFTIVGGPLTTTADPLHLQWSCTGGTLSGQMGLSIQYRAGGTAGSYSVSAYDGRFHGYAHIDIR